MGGAAPAPPAVTLEEMKAARVPIEERDQCAGLLIPLNECRYKTGFLTWKCENERLEYEYCLYRDYLRRVEKCDAVRAAGGSCTAPAYRRDATD